MPTQSASLYLPFGENKHAEWYGRDIISVKQFTRKDLEYVFGVAHEMRGMVERIGTFDATRSFKGWWFAILRNCCIDASRLARRHKTAPPTEAGLTLVSGAVGLAWAAFRSTEYYERLKTRRYERAIEARLAARKAKNFAESDRIRDELAAQGIVLKDGPSGTTWEVKK